ncbi:LamG-like jellyroll fold domain-containing protein [Streptosporangium sp. NPDC051023]|uniref:phage distal tail protein n=1 Tax=Streptosporangium sp. NPDC051023 TaxID=3155410 RepID=UPI00344EA466
MAVRFSGSGQSYTRTISLGAQSQWSVSCWFKITTDRNTYSSVWSLDQDSGARLGFTMLRTDSDGTTLSFLANDNDVTSITKGTRALTVGVWYYIGVAVNGANGVMVTRALTDTSSTVTTWSDGPASVMHDTWRIGDDFFGGEWPNGCVAAVKWWGAALSQGELENEAWTYQPRRAANLRGWHPFDRASTVDYSGAGATLSGGTGATTEDGPGIAWSPAGPVMVAPTGVSTTATPSAVAAVAAVPTPTVTAGAGVAATAVAAVAAVPAPTVSTGQATAPAAVAAVAAVPAPTVTVGSISIASPAAVAAVAAVPTPTVSTGQSVAPASVAAVASVPAPSLVSGATILATTVAALARVPLPSITVPILPGDLIEADGQVELGGVLWGTDRIRVQEISGWESLPSIDNGNVLRPQRHGAWVGRKIAQQRLVTIKMRLNSADDPTQVQALVREMRAATRIFDGPEETDLVIRTYGEQLLARGAVIDRDIVLDSDWSVGQPAVSVLIACADPRRYDTTVVSAVVANGSSAAVVNSGDTASHPIVRINGPATSPSLANLTTEKLLAFNITLLANERLEIDTNEGAVTLGGADHMSALSAVSVPPEAWFLTSGTNVISYSASSGGSNGAEIQWRSAFL